MSQLIQHAIEHGFIKYYDIRSLFIINNLQSNDENNSVVNMLASISMADLDFVFVIYLCGMASAIVTFVVELIWKRARLGKDRINRKLRRNRKNKNKRPKIEIRIQTIQYLE